MPSSRTKSGLFQHPNDETRRPSSSKSEEDSQSHSNPPFQTLRLSTDRCSPKFSTATKVARPVKGSDLLQHQLNAAQEELRNAKLRLASVESEKAPTLEELFDTKKLADETTAKLSEALVALGKSEKDIEIERFRIVQLEKAGIESARQQEDAWEKEIETVRNHHAIDVSALFSTTKELQRLHKELVMTTEAKNMALSHANDAMKIAEMNADRVEILSGEVAQLKVLVDSKSDSELNALRCEIEKVKGAEKRLIELETLAEILRLEVTNAKRVESAAIVQVDEWKKKVELLQVKMEESIRNEISLSESLVSNVKQLQICNDQLREATLEICQLEEKVESLESELIGHQNKLDDTEYHLKNTKREVSELEKIVEALESEIVSATEEKKKALNDEKRATADLQSLLEERERILSDLENSRDEVEASKKSIDGLVSALHEASADARESSESLLLKQAQVADARDHIERSNRALKSIEERYMAMLSDAHYKMVGLEAENSASETEAKSLRSVWNQKEQSFLLSLKKSEEEANTVKSKLNESATKLKESEVEAVAAEGEKVQLLVRLKEAELEVVGSSEAIGKAKARSLQLKQVVLDKEVKLQSITQENDHLRSREEITVERIKKLISLLEEATKNTAANAKLGSNENGGSVEESLEHENKSDMEEEEASVESADDSESSSKIDHESVENTTKKKSAILSKFGGLLKKKKKNRQKN